MINLANKLYFKGLLMKEKASKLWKNESGETNIIAIVLILAIVIALAIVFKGALTSLFNKIWDALDKKVDSVI